ncbi:MAG: hypothetical protein ACYSUX_07610 [Planctomycetota bacterium]
MRKKISCKIIKSVPLDAGGNRSACSADRRTVNAERRIGASTYTPRLIVKKTCFDEKSAAQFLDCCA